jgi:hypothetical protein
VPNQYRADKQGKPTAEVCLRLTEVTLNGKPAVRVIEFSKQQQGRANCVGCWQLNLRKLSTNRELADATAVATSPDLPTYYS